MGASLTSAITDVVGIFTTNVVPLITSAPFVYYFGASLFGLGCAVLTMVKRSL